MEPDPCLDIDECHTAGMRTGGPCAQQAKCTNTDGSFTCVCETGYLGDAYAGPCQWIDTPCPAGQYSKTTTFGDCADLPKNAHESFHFKFKSMFSFKRYPTLKEMKTNLSVLIIVVPIGIVCLVLLKMKRQINVTVTDKLSCNF